MGIKNTQSTCWELLHMIGRQIWMKGFITLHFITFGMGAIVVMIVWQLNLQLPVESVPITSKVVSSNLVHGEVYSIQHYVTQYISDFRQIGSFRLVLQLPPPISWLPRYSWHIVESGIKHRKPKPIWDGFKCWCIV